MKLNEILSNESEIMKDLETFIDDKGIHSSKKDITGEDLRKLLEEK